MKSWNKKKTVILIIVGGITLFLASGYFLGGYVAGLAVSHAIFDKRQSEVSDLETDYKLLACKTRADFPLMNERKTLTFTSGSNTLTSYFYEVSDPKGLVVSCHGLGSLSDGDNAEYQNYFLEQGYDVLALNLTAHGPSQGNTLPGLYQSPYNVASCIDAVFKETRFYIPTNYIALVGHSMGGYGVASALSFTEHSVNAVVSFSAFASGEEEMIAMAHTKVGVLAEMTSLPFKWALEKRDGGQSKFSAVTTINEHPETKFVLVQGNEDGTVPFKTSLYNKSFANPNVKKILLDKATHIAPWRTLEANTYLRKDVAALWDSLSGPNQIADFKKAVQEQGIKEKTSKLNLSVLEETLNYIR